MKTIKKNKKTKLKTNKLSLVKSKNTPAYYHCLANKAIQGLKPSITSCCHDCKEKSTQIANVRQQEIKKLTEAYKQIGLSLSKLLAHG